MEKICGCYKTECNNTDIIDMLIVNTEIIVNYMLTKGFSVRHIDCSGTSSSHDGLVGYMARYLSINDFLQNCKQDFLKEDKSFPLLYELDFSTVIMRMHEKDNVETYISITNYSHMQHINVCFNSINIEDLKFAKDVLSSISEATPFILRN